MRFPFGNDVFIKIIHNGKPITTKVKEVQRNPVSQELMHVDLMPVGDRTDVSGQVH